MGNLRRIALMVGLLMIISITPEGCRRRTPEERGRAATDENIATLKGTGDSLQKNGREAGRSFGRGIAETMVGIQEGMEDTTSKIYAAKDNFKVWVSPDFTALGIKITRVQMTKTGVVNAYLNVTKSFKRSLRLRAMDKDNLEIGRSLVAVSFPAGYAGYVDFPLDSRTPVGMVTSFSFELYASGAASAPAVREYK